MIVQNADRRGTDARRGAAIVPALLATGMVLALCMSYLTVSSGITRRLRTSADEKQAFALAEAGLAESYAGLAINKTGNVGTEQAPATIGDGVFWVEATDRGDGVYELESTALYGMGRAALGMVVRREQVSMAALGMFSSASLVVPAGALVDGYDSCVDTYQAHVDQGLNEVAIVGSNDQVDVSGSVLGDVIHGPVAGSSVQVGGSVTGTQSARGLPQPLPAVEVPALTSLPAQTVASRQSYVVPPGELGLDGLRVNAGGEAILKGPLTLVVGDFVLDGNASLTFDNSAGAIDVYVTSSLDFQAGSTVSTLSDDPGQLTLQIVPADAPAASFAATGSLFGQLYAPQGAIEVLAPFELFGSVIADTMTLGAGVQLHFDRNTIPSRSDSLPRMWSWQVLEVPQAMALSTSDPFVLMGLDQSTLPDPSHAHEDQTLSVEYVDDVGVTRSFSGPESAFDWAIVKEVQFGARNGEQFGGWEDQPKGLSVAEEAKSRSPVEQDIVDAKNSGASSADLFGRLTAAYPVGEDVLVEMIQSGAMSSGDLYWVLLEYGPAVTGYVGGRADAPMADSLMLDLIGEEYFSSKHLSWILQQNSPLDPAVLDAAVNRVPAMKNSDLNRVLFSQ